MPTAQTKLSRNVLESEHSPHQTVSKNAQLGTLINDNLDQFVRLALRIIVVLYEKPS